jgi:primosomal protein N''
VNEIKSRVETSESEASSSEEEAITYITEGIEATYVVEKKHQHDKKKKELKEKENEYNEKKQKYDEEKSKLTRDLNQKKQRLATCESEVSDL